MSQTLEKPTDISIPAGGLWAKLPLIAGLVGVLGMGATFGLSMGEHKARGMFSYLWAFEGALSIALAALGWVLIQHLVRAGWSTVVRRIGETAMATLPLFVLLFIPIALYGFHDLYIWSHESDEILERKRWFLANPFFFGRAAFYFICWSGLAWVLYSRSVKQDSMTPGAARDEVSRSMWRLSAGGVFLYGLTQSFQAIDWLMSLAPHWYSTIFGVYFFAGSMICFYSFTTLIAMALQKGGLLKTAISTEHYHDLGKFIFGHTVFWAYIAFSQFVLIWYANIPEETVFYMQRVEGGWENISYALPIIHFFLPFLFLVSRHVKRNRTLLAVAAVYSIVVHLIDLFWLVVPNFKGHHAEAAAEHAGAAEAIVPPALRTIEHAAPFALALTDVTALLGIGGLFLATFAFLLKRNKVICIGDPRLEESLGHQNY